MANVRQVILAAPFYLIAIAIFTLASLAIAEAQDETLNEAEIYEMDSGSKDFVIDLIAAGVWTKDNDEFKQFNKYGPKAKLNIPKYNEETDEFEETKIL